MGDNGISSNQIEMRDGTTARERHLARRVADMEAVLLADPKTDRARLVAALAAVQYAAEEAERLRNELDALLVERTGMNSEEWAQEALDHLEFQRKDNRSGGAARCKTCGRGSFVDGRADMDLSDYECPPCAHKRVTQERDDARASVARVLALADRLAIYTPAVDGAEFVRRVLGEGDASRVGVAEAIRKAVEGE